MDIQGVAKELQRIRLGKALKGASEAKASGRKDIELQKFKNVENSSPAAGEKYEDLQEEEENDGPLEAANAAGRDPEEEFNSKREGAEIIVEGLETDRTEDIELNDSEESYCYRLKSVCQNYVAALLCVAITGLYFIVTGIQYWVSDYMISVLEVEESIVFTTFGIISITGPVLGVVVGGNVTTSFGGCSAKKSLYLCCGIAAGCLVCAAPIPFVTNFPLFITLLWFLLFFGGFILPAMTGIMLATVDDSLKATANALANLFYNLGGYLPAPYIYGAIYELGEGNNAKMAMSTLMFSPVSSVVALFAATYYIVKLDILGYKKAAQAKTLREQAI